MLKRIITLICIFALIITMGGEVILSALTVSAASEEKQYSNVLDDLKKDSTFDVATYPDDTEDVSVKLIQIAESEDGQLFLYVYQPADSKIDLKCTSVSISVGFSSNGQGLDPKLYDLILVSSEGVFDKYLVNGFVLPDEAERYYNIVSLYREFNSAVDEVTDVVTSEKAYSVGQQWCAYYLNDHLVYEMNTFETIDIECTLSSKIVLKNGIMWGNLVGLNEKCYAHYYAFNCDEYIIKKIFDADLTFTSEELLVTYSSDLSQSTTSSNGKNVEYLTLTSSDVMHFEGQGLFGMELSWNRIMSSDDFLNTLASYGASIGDNDFSILEGSQWVFSFKETPTSSTTQMGVTTHAYTEITDVSVLRLHFQDNSGKIYDLGVVSDKVDNTGISGEVGGTDWDKLTDMLGKILGLFGLCAIFFMLSFISPIIKSFINAIWGVIKFGFNVSIAIITWPFRFLWGLLSGK